MKRVVMITVALLLAAASAAAQDQVKTGSITGNGQSVCLPMQAGGSGTIQVSGTYTGTLAFKQTAEAAGTNLQTLTALDGSTGTTSTGLFVFSAAGLAQACVTSTAFSSGTAAITIRVSPGTGIVASASGPGGSGDGKILDGTAAGQADVIGTTPGGTEQGLVTRPIFDISTLATQTTLSAVNGKLNAVLTAIGNTVDPLNMQVVAGKDIGLGEYRPFPLTSSGNAVSVAASSLPLPTGAATEATLGTVNGKLPATVAADRTTAAAPGAVRLSDGAAFYKATTPSDTQPISGTVTANAGSGTFTVSGTVTANAGSGTMAVSSSQLPAALAASGGLKVDLSGTGGNATAVKVDGSAVTQPVSGSVTVSGTVTGNQGTANTTANAWPIKVTDGTDTANVTGTSLDVNCTGGCGGAASFADNAAFTFGTTPITTIGAVFDDTSPNTATENSAAILRMTQNKGLHVNLRNASGTEIGTASTPVRTDPTGSTIQPVSGTVTANAGTNLNTSALALSATQTDRTQKSQITDGTRDGTVKAASTAAAATDTSLVVGLSPNSPLPAGSNALGSVTVTGTTAVSGTVTANQGTGAATTSSWPTQNGTLAKTTGTIDATSVGSTVTATGLGGMSGLGVYFTPTFTGTPPIIQAEFSTDGTTWFVGQRQNVTSGSTLTFAATASISPTGTVQYWQLVIPYGADRFRVRLTGASTTGNIVVDIYPVANAAPPASLTMMIRDGGTSGSASAAVVKGASTAAVATDQALVVAVSPNNTVPVNMTQLAGVTVSSGQGVADTGTIRVSQAQELTYAASTTAKTATAAGTAAFFEICGSGTKTIRIQRITVSGTVATAAIYGDVTIRKTSAAATGGTATTLTNVPYDSNSAAATATAKYFTVLPTGGSTLVGVIYSQTAFYPLTGTVASFVPQLERVWRDTDSEAPTLRGTAQCITAGFGTTPTNAPTLTVSVAWTEK